MVVEGARKGDGDLGGRGKEWVIWKEGIDWRTREDRRINRG